MRSLGLLLLSAVSVLGCSRNTKSRGAGAPEEVLARIGDRVISASDLERQIQKQPAAARARYASPELRKQLLDDMIRFEVLAAHAEKRGYDRDPEVQRLLRQFMVNQLVQREFEGQERPEDLPEAELKRYYEAHPLEYSREEEVRVSQIVVADQATAEKVLAKTRTLHPTDLDGFRRLVNLHSEDQASKARGGDMLFFDRRTATQPRTVVDASFAIADVNGLAPLVRSERGFHILRLTERRPALTQAFGDVKDEIQQRLHQERRTRRMEQWLVALRAQQKVETFEQQLKTVIVPGPTASAGAPR